MAVLYKSTVEASLKELETYYESLKKVLQGSEVHVRESCMYVARPDQTPIVSVNIDRLLDAVGHFRVSVDALRRMNAKAIKPSRSPLFDPSEH